MTFNIFDRAFFGDNEQFDTKIHAQIAIAEPAISVSDATPVIGTFTSVKIVFNSRIKPTEDVSI